MGMPPFALQQEIELLVEERKKFFVKGQERVWITRKRKNNIAISEVILSETLPMNKVRKQ